MPTNFNKLGNVLCALFLSIFSSAATFAQANDLIQTLYHAEPVADADDDIPHFNLDGELGILVNTGNTSAASVKAVSYTHLTLPTIYSV